MIIGIVGGILQGMEAVYLCKHAGYTSLVIDKNPKAPAMYLADRSETCDVLNEPDRAKRIFSECDAVIPAVEDLKVLEFLNVKFSDICICCVHGIYAPFADVHGCYAHYAHGQAAGQSAMRGLSDA